MTWKKLGRALLFPHIIIMIILIPVSVMFLVYSMVVLGTESIVAIISYVIAAYTLTVWCVKIPLLIRFFREFKNSNKYVVLWSSDTRLRTNITLVGTLVWNGAYAIFHLVLGIMHHSFWFSSLACYYMFLALMRFYLVRYTAKNAPGSDLYRENRKYRACGIALLVMNLALALMIFFMVYWNRTFNHHEITTIALAAYTFTTLTRAIINIVKYRKLGSPVYSASKAVSLASACVSMLTLEATMLTTFGGETIDLFTRRIFLGASGAAVAAFIIAMAIYMIVRSTKMLRVLKTEKE